jgi:acyl-CoA reductase-like NAD-dependent aldehyde dehydrogenase
MTKEQINEKVKKAQDTFGEWKKDPDKRTDLLHDIAQELKKNKEELARRSQEKWERPLKRPDLR